MNLVVPTKTMSHILTNEPTPHSPQYLPAGAFSVFSRAWRRFRRLIRRRGRTDQTPPATNAILEPGVNTTNSSAMLPTSGHERSPADRRLDAIKKYIRETNSVADLSRSRLTIEEVDSIFKILEGSQISELNLSTSILKGRMKLLAQNLPKTKIKKLNLTACQLTGVDVLILMSDLKATQITDLNISKNELRFENSDYETFISCLVASTVKSLNIAGTLLFYNSRGVEFIRRMREMSITHLNLRSVFSRPASDGTFAALLSHLKYTSITHLNLANNWIAAHDLVDSACHLVSSKVLDLDLSENMINDAGVDALFVALIGSKVTTLNLASNYIKGLNSLGSRLRSTEITTLNLSRNDLKEARMFTYPGFLRNSSVVSLILEGCNISDTLGTELMKSLQHSEVKDLNVSGNELGHRTLAEFGRVVMFTHIERFNFSSNYKCFLDKTGCLHLDFFGRNLARSELKHIDISNCFRFEVPRFLAFVEHIKNCSIVSVSSSGPSFLTGKNVKILSRGLKHSHFTHIDISGNCLGEGIAGFIKSIRHSLVTHLNLSKCCIDDKCVEMLAKHLKETRVCDLNLSRNGITCPGAIALAHYLKDAGAFNLKLNYNLIKNQGLKALAESLKNNPAATLEVEMNPGDIFLIEEVIWNNRRSVL